MENKYPDIHNFINLNNDEQALLAATLCNYLYTYECSDFVKWKKRIDLDTNNVSINSVNSLKYMVLSFDQFDILVINGTDIHNGLLETIKDLSISFNLLPYRGKNRKIYHRGYYKSALRIANDLLSKNLITRKPLVITGHSMGGSIGKVLASEILPNIHTLITFGSPQVTNDIEIEKSIKHVDYVKTGDIIPWFPSVLYYGNNEISHINKDSSITRLRLPKNTMIISVILRIIEVSRQNIGIFNPHAITSYIRSFLIRNKHK